MCGGRLTQVPVKHHPRVAGKTKYNLTRTLRVVLDLITVKFLYSYLTRPMHFLGTGGLFAIGLGFASVLGAIAMKLYSQTDMTGNPLLLLSVMLVLVGIQLISMGLLGIKCKTGWFVFRCVEEVSDITVDEWVWKFNFERC